jgi:hypothetical protein
MSLFDIYFSKEIMVRELQTALEDSKKAVDNAEERLVRKDEKIINLESEKQEHQGTENIPPVGRLCPPLSIRHSSQEFIFNKPLQNTSRVLQVVLTPLQTKLTAHHTKSSLLRLKNSPAAKANRGRTPVRKNIMNRIVEEKENMNIVKRKLDDRSVDRLNTSKRRRVSNSVKRKFARLSGKQSGLKYNLRTRH